MLRSSISHNNVKKLLTNCEKLKNSYNNQGIFFKYFHLFHIFFHKKIKINNMEDSRNIDFAQK